MGIAAADRAQEIEDEVAEVAERVLDVVGEHPQEDHVAEEVPEVAVEEGVGDERQQPGTAARSAGQVGFGEDGRDQAEG